MKTTKQSKEKMRDWTHNRDMWIRVLEKKTDKSLAHWNARIKKEKFADVGSLKSWLAQQGVTGYASQLLVMERFGYPDFVTTSADALIDRAAPGLRVSTARQFRCPVDFGHCLSEATSRRLT